MAYGNVFVKAYDENSMYSLERDRDRELFDLAPTRRFRGSLRIRGQMAGRDTQWYRAMKR